MGETLKELFSFFIQKKKFWLIPVVLILVIVSVMITLAPGAVVAPFVYSLF